MDGMGWRMGVPVKEPLFMFPWMYEIFTYRFTINTWQMQVNIPYMEQVGK